jgi:hypothetical protein
MKHFVATWMILAVPSIALAQKADAEQPPWVGLICTGSVAFLLIPLLVLLFVVLRRSGAMRQGEYLAKGADHIERANEHMARQEERELRIIELLESIERQMKRSDGAKSEGIKKV